MSYFKVNGFIPFYFTLILLNWIHAFLDRKLFTSEIANIFDKCPFSIVISSLMVSGYPESVYVDVLYVHCISCSSCLTSIMMNLMSPFTLYFTSMIGSWIFGIVGLYEVSNFLSAFSTLSYADVSMSASILWYVNSHELGFLICPHIFSLIRDYLHRKFDFWLWSGNLVLLYT